MCDVKQPHKSATPFLVPTLFLLLPLSSCHFTSLLPLCYCNECPSPIHPTNVIKPCVSHPHFLLVLCVCAVVSTHTTAPSHSLIASSIGCPMCGDCLFPWCCVVWLSVGSAGRQCDTQTQQHANKKHNSTQAWLCGVFPVCDDVAWCAVWL